MRHSRISVPVMEDGRTGERGRPVGRAPASALLLRPRSSEPSQPKRAGRVSRRTLIWPFGSADLGRSRCTPAPAASTSSSSEILAFLTAVIGDNIGFAVGHSGGRLVERFGRYIPGTVLFTLRAALSETPCLLGATGRASTQRGLHQGKAKVRKDAERSAANQNGCERFDAQLADCRIDRRGATMVTRTTPPLLVPSGSPARPVSGQRRYRCGTISAVPPGAGRASAMSSFRSRDRHCCFGWPPTESRS